MTCADACVPPENNVFSDIVSTITLEVVTEIQKELETCDLISLVFLLYDVPDTALQRLVILQRVSKDIDGNHLDLLTDWALHAEKSETSWRLKFLEALAICQLFNTLKKLGCNIPKLKAHYSSSSHKPQINSYINPLKITLYKLCENMTSYTFNNLKKTLDSFEQNVMQYDTCELVFLELMCQKFINVDHSKYEKGATGKECKVEKLIKIIDRYPELIQFTGMLKEMEEEMNINLEPVTTSAPTSNLKSSINTMDKNCITPEELNDELSGMFAGMNVDDLSQLESDRNALKQKCYVIKKKERVGICCIINQEVFYPSRHSIEHNSAKRPLEDRAGSTRDKIKLEKTMRSLNFDIMTKENLNKKEMVAFIQETLKKVTEDDSVFMLCILSHGIKGHVYAADSVAIKVDYIQNVIDDTPSLRGIPKVLILQACQVEADDEPSGFAADGPQYTLPKTDFLVCWATSPELEAFRNTQFGSLFIQLLCTEIEKYADNEHLYDLVTEVTNKVTALCIAKKCKQVPISLSTLRKKLYLRSPKGV